MMYVVKFTVDLYIQDQLVIPSYEYRYSDLFDTVSIALHYQETIKAHFMNHDVFGILECDEGGEALKFLQYGAWSIILPCSEKRAMEIAMYNEEGAGCY